MVTSFRHKWRWLFFLFLVAILFIVFNSASLLTKVDPAKKKKWESISVHSAVRFKEHVLVLLKHGYSTPTLPSKSMIQCRFGSYEKSVVLSINEDWTVLCSHPRAEVKKLMVGELVTLEIEGIVIFSKAHYPSKNDWTRLLYASVALDDKLLLFAKGLVTKKKMKRPPAATLSMMRCVFDGKFETNVTEMCQENILCDLPPVNQRNLFDQKPVKVRVGNYSHPSAVLLDLDLTPETLSDQAAPRIPGSAQPIHKICACTMVWNVAKHVHEWVSYHAHLGVERFFFYDNNSDDDLRQVVSNLSSVYTISVHNWPWLKTQEAGFAHCTIRAQRLCEWVLFTDVDEFLYPTIVLNKFESNVGDGGVVSRGNDSIIGQLITETQSLKPTAKLGNIEIMCQDFGPSGLDNLPRSGQMVNYVCALRRPSRHKSLVKLDSLSPTRCNRIHHFEIKEDYENHLWRRSKAEIKHYKYQVWDDFKLRFHHRVATYVKDWHREIRFSTNRDRVKGLKSDAIKPSDWSTRFCEENDTRLRDYVEKTLRDSHTHLLPWE